MRNRIVLLALVSLALAPSAPVRAQSLDSAVANIDPFSVSVSPQYLSPGGQATLSFLSSMLDLTNATLSVSSGGKTVYQGSVQPVAISLGKTGSATTVVAKVTQDGASYSQSVTLQPEDVSLVAEPLSSAPALYPGKPSVPLGGSTRLVAIANFKDAAGKTLDPASLSYSWTVDGMLIANSSGIGRTTIVVASPLKYRVRTVSVSVQSQAGSLVGGAELTLDPADPSVLIYENDPLLGIRFGHAVSGSYAVRGSETSLYAATFSFPLGSQTPLLQWFLNGDSAQTGPVITLRPTGSGQGSAPLSLMASLGDSLRATTGTELSFGTKTSSNFLGL